jgi:ABC-type spermidine/putrescine transport system permease subunit II
MPILGAVETVTWVKVQKPTFDLVGVVLSSFGIAGICAGVTLVLGALFGVLLIRQNRQPGRTPRVSSILQ